MNQTYLINKLTWANDTHYTANYLLYCLTAYTGWLVKEFFLFWNKNHSWPVCSSGSVGLSLTTPAVVQKKLIHKKVSMCFFLQISIII